MTEDTGNQMLNPHISIYLISKSWSFDTKTYITIHTVYPFNIKIYSQTCIKRSPLGQEKSGLLRQVTS
jgi:hypothetical protein